MTYYTLKEVMQILKVSERTVYRWLYSGKLKASKAGRQWRIAKDDLEAFMIRN